MCFSLGLLQGQENCCMLATLLSESRGHSPSNASKREREVATGCQQSVGRSATSRRRREPKLCRQHFNLVNLFRQPLLTWVRVDRGVKVGKTE